MSSADLKCFLPQTKELGSVSVSVKQLLETKGDPLRVGILDASGAPLNANASLCVSATLTSVSVCDDEMALTTQFHV
jgi:hypothetical protein